jgi:hypothetical protein
MPISSSSKALEASSDRYRQTANARKLKNEEEYKVKTWIFILIVMAAATSVVNDRIEIPGRARQVTTHSIATD